jgi:hypothetical protein
MNLLFTLTNPVCSEPHISYDGNTYVSTDSFTFTVNGKATNGTIDVPSNTTSITIKVSTSEAAVKNVVFYDTGGTTIIGTKSESGNSITLSDLDLKSFLNDTETFCLLVILADHRYLCLDPKLKVQQGD